MSNNVKYLKDSWDKRTSLAKEKAIKSIQELKSKKEPINFSSVSKYSGVSKHFLYGNEEIKLIIEAERSEECHRKALWHDKYDKTSKSKDVIIESKDRYIKKLEVEIEQLRKEINQLRALIYDKSNTSGTLYPK